MMVSDALQRCVHRPCMSGITSRLILPCWKGGWVHNGCIMGGWRGWESGGGREEESLCLDCSWGVWFVMRGSIQGEEERHRCSHDGMILSPFPPFLSFQFTLSYPHSISSLSHPSPFSLSHSPYDSSTHCVPFRTPFTTLSHYTTDDPPRISTEVEGSETLEDSAV